MEGTFPLSTKEEAGLLFCLSSGANKKKFYHCFISKTLGGKILDSLRCTIYTAFAKYQAAFGSTVPVTHTVAKQPAHNYSGTLPELLGKCIAFKLIY